MVDIGAKHNGYASDITRTFPVKGKFSPNQRKFYQLVLDAQQAAINSIRAGVTTLEDLTTVVRDFFRQSPLRARDRYGNETTMDNFFTHNTSHYVGRHVHGIYLGLSPSSPIVANSVFTIEPGLYIPSQRIGIRIEDDFVLDKTGKVINLNPNLALTLKDIETFMQRQNSTVSGLQLFSPTTTVFKTPRHFFHPEQSQAEHMDF